MKNIFFGLGLISLGSLTFLSTAMAEDFVPSEHRPVISPDGKSVVFMSTRNDEDWELYQVNLDGSGFKRLTNHPGWDGYASFAPNGTVFTYDREDGEAKDDGSSKTPYVYDLKTGETWPFLKVEGAWATVNDWSPDGSSVVLFVDRDKKRDLYTADSNGENLKQLTDTPDVNEHDAQFSPDGKKLAFADTREGGSDINIMDLATGAVTRVHSSTQYAYGIGWSPDGTRIAFTDTPNDNPDGNAELYVLDVTNGEVEQLTHNEDYDHMPVWVSNSEIMFTSYASGHEEIYTLDLETGEVKNFPTGQE